MASANANDFIFDANVTEKLTIFHIDAAGASRVSMSVTTQLGTGTAGDLLAGVEGSNDGALWFDVTDTAGGVGVGLLGAEGVLGSVDGFAFVRAFFQRASTTVTAKFLLSASINTGN
jgi:hypothetical protein